MIDRATVAIAASTHGGGDQSGGFQVFSPFLSANIAKGDVRYPTGLPIRRDLSATGCVVWPREGMDPLLKTAHNRNCFSIIFISVVQFQTGIDRHGLTHKKSGMDL